MKTSLLALVTNVIASTAMAGSVCQLPQAPAAFLDLVSKAHPISVSVGKPEHTRAFDLITQKADIPNLFSPCRMTPVVITGEDSLTHQPRQVTVMDYSTGKVDRGTQPTVLLLPPTGGENALDDAYADHLCKQGFRVVLVQHWAQDTVTSLDLGMHDRGTMRMTSAVEDVVSFIDPKTDSQLGILGTSVGAISASLMLGVESRISTGVLIVGGVGMAEIIGKSDEKTLTALRNERLAKMGLANSDAYIAALSGAIQIEPLRFVDFAKKKNVLSYVALADTTVPTENQWTLVHALGTQNVITYNADHYHTILHTGLKEKSRITDFFSAHLKAPTAAEVAAHRPLSPDENKLCLNARAN